MFYVIRKKLITSRNTRRAERAKSIKHTNLVQAISQVSSTYQPSILLPLVGLLPLAKNSPSNIQQEPTALDLAPRLKGRAFTHMTGAFITTQTL